MKLFKTENKSDFFFKKKIVETAENDFQKKTFYEENINMFKATSVAEYFFQFVSVFFAFEFVGERFSILFPEYLKGFFLEIVLSLIAMIFLEFFKVFFIKDFLKSYFQNQIELSKAKYSTFIISLLLIFISFFTTIKGSEDYIDKMTNKEKEIKNEFVFNKDSISKVFNSQIDKIEKENERIKKEVAAKIKAKKLLIFPQNEKEILLKNEEKITSLNLKLKDELNEHKEERNEVIVKNKDFSLKNIYYALFFTIFTEVMLLLCVYFQCYFLYYVFIENTLESDIITPKTNNIQQSINNNFQGKTILPQDTPKPVVQVIQKPLNNSNDLDINSIPKLKLPESFNNKKTSDLTKEEKFLLGCRAYLLKYKEVVLFLYEREIGKNNLKLEEIAEKCNISISTLNNVKRVYDNI